MASAIEDKLFVALCFRTGSLAHHSALLNTLRCAEAAMLSSMMLSISWSGFVSWVEASLVIPSCVRRRNWFMLLIDCGNECNFRRWRPYAVVQAMPCYAKDQKSKSFVLIAREQVHQEPTNQLLHLLQSSWKQTNCIGLFGVRVCDPGLGSTQADAHALKKTPSFVVVFSDRLGIENYVSTFDICFSITETIWVCAIFKWACDSTPILYTPSFQWDLAVSIIRCAHLHNRNANTLLNTEDSFVSLFILAYYDTTWTNSDTLQQEIQPLWLLWWTWLLSSGFIHVIGRWSLSYPLNEGRLSFRGGYVTGRWSLRIGDISCGVSDFSRIIWSQRPCDCVVCVGLAADKWRRIVVDIIVCEFWSWLVELYCALRDNEILQSDRWTKL